MKQLVIFVCALTVVMGTLAHASAQVADCPYDVVGTTTRSPLTFSPDNMVTYGGGPNWWEDDVVACYYTYFYPAYYPYFTGCDFDESGAVERQEVLDMYYFIQDYPATEGSWAYAFDCDTIIDDPCEDLADVDFGDPTQALGVAIIDGSCSLVVGSEVPEGYEVFSNTAECQTTCFGCTTNDDCSPDEYCHLDDFTCGSAGNGSCETRPDACVAIYDPVCTCDYTTASSSCVASMYGKSMMADGECAEEDTCNHNGGSWSDNSCDCPEGTTYNWMRGCETD